MLDPLRHALIGITRADNVDFGRHDIDNEDVHIRDCRTDTSDSPLPKYDID